MNPDTFLNLKKSVFQKFNLNIQKRLAKLIWFMKGCQSWCISGKNKKNVTIWPITKLSYRIKTKKIKLSDYNIVLTKQ